MQHVKYQKAGIITVPLQLFWAIKSCIYGLWPKKLRFSKSSQGHVEIKVFPMQNDSLKEKACNWTWVSLASAFLQVSILAIIFNIYSTVEVSLLMEELLSDANVYPDFYFLTFWQVLYNNMIAVNIFFAWIKVLALIPFFVLKNQHF